MPRGGSKPGERRGGRQKGTANKRTREIADRATAEGITPLEVMLKAMRLKAGEEDWGAAADIASKAAPYMHPRLQNIDLTSTNEHYVCDVSADPVSPEDWESQYSAPH